MTASMSQLRIGTRGSPLALAQAHTVRTLLAAAHPSLAAEGAIEIEIIKTTGDSVVDRTLSSIGGKGLFTKEIEQALIEQSIDLAVHSMKDVPTYLPDGLIVDCILEREDPRDAFFSSDGRGIGELEPDSVVGTASLRRQAQILHARPDLRIVPFRGNVETRLAKLASGVVDATVLAVAGMKRLGRAEQIQTIISPEIMLPSVAQGAIGIERRIADERVAALLAPLNHAESAARILAERTLLGVLDGSCRTPIGGLAEISEGTLTLRALVIRPDGSVRHDVVISGAVADAARIGHEAGMDLKHRAGPGFFSMPLPDAPAR